MLVVVTSRVSDTETTSDWANVPPSSTGVLCQQMPKAAAAVAASFDKSSIVIGAFAFDLSSSSSFLPLKL